MVAQLPVIILLSLSWFLRPLQAVNEDNINGTLINSVEKYLNGSAMDFDTWTEQMSQVLEEKQQERLAWNASWETILQDGRISLLLELQNKLKPNNFLKLRLWMSFYFYLRKFEKLNKILLANFALELREIRMNPQIKWSYYLQNILQSLKRPLWTLAESRWLCLQHKKEMFYVSSGYHLELGANDHCSLWRIQEAVPDYLLLLVNSCNQERYFFINLLDVYQESVQLLRPTSYMNNTFCVVKGVAYFRETSQVSEGDLACRWQVNNCSYSPSLLSE